MNFTKKLREQREKLKPPADWGKSLTRQEFKEDVDINRIVAKARLGHFVSGAVKQGFYEDVSEIGDYHQAQVKIKAVENEFLKIPSEIRLKFGNSPSALADFVLNPENKEKALEMGLLEPEKTIPIPKVEVVNPTPTEGPDQ